MRNKLLVLLCLALCVSAANAELAPETVGSETLAEPGKNWVLGKSRRGAYVYDADTGEMQAVYCQPLAKFQPLLSRASKPYADHSTNPNSTTAIV